MLAGTAAFAQQDSTRQDSTKVYDLGAVYESSIEQQQELRKQFDEIELSKKAFLIGYFAGRERTLTEQDSVVFISPTQVQVFTRKKKK